MIEFFAPYPLPTARLALESAQWGNAARNQSEVKLKRSMDGATAVSYVRKQDSKELEFEIQMLRMKAFELEEFYTAYSAEKMKLVLHGVEYVGYLTLNPLPLSFARRGVASDSTETVTVTITFKSEP